MKDRAFPETPPHPNPPHQGEGELIGRGALDILNFLNLSRWTPPFPPR
jgi:hypothetical protein